MVEGRQDTGSIAVRTDCMTSSCRGWGPDRCLAAIPPLKGACRQQV